MSETTTRRVLISEKDGSYFLAMGKNQGRPIAPADLPKDYDSDAWWEDWGPKVDTLEDLHAEIDRLFR